MFTRERLHYLMEKARSRQASSEEVSELLSLIALDEEGKVIEALNRFHAVPEQPGGEVLPAELSHLYQVAREVLEADKLPAAAPVKRIRPFYRWLAAAGVLLLAAGSWLWLQQPSATQTPGSTARNEKAAAVAPEKGTVLTLSDGRQVVLDSLGNGIVAAENGAQVVFKNGSLVYNGKATAGAAMVYNTITTPRGRQFSLTLPDGSRVWLNAMSTLKYPVAFSGAAREVALTGEGYFEIAPDARMPFVVNNQRLQIEVLGTSFNLMCYAEEPDARATLVTGAVQVKKDNHTAVLQPGEQVVAADTRWKVVNADVEAVLAWKNGVFHLNNADIATVMRQMARWYDVEIAYPGGVPDKPLAGYLQREKGLEESIEILQASGVHCRLEGKTLIINN